MNRYERCPNCMNTLTGEGGTCPSCGFDFIHYEEKSTCLKPFTVLQNKYMIGRVIGVGGFGITYIGWDLNLQTYIAIKEYFPDSIASRDTTASPDVTQVVPNESKVDFYEKGLKRYVEEAQNLSKFYNLQGIVSVKDFFYENGTGYIVMEYINGINLKEFLRNSGGKLEESTVLALMKPVLESMYQIHNGGLVHRDISPDNIMVDGNGKIKLIDFGSARGESAESDKTYTVILKHGYAPSEQYYAKGKQGPWTDIYSICATMYKMLTGQIPPNSVERMEMDEYVAPTALGIAISPRTEAVIAKGLAVKATDRYQNIGEMLADLYGEAPINSNISGMTVNNSAPFTSPVSQQSLSQQSMHLSMQPVMNTQSEVKKKSKAPMIAGISVAALAVIAVIVILITGGPNKKKKSSTSNTASSTDAVTTTEVAGSTAEPGTIDPGQIDPGQIDPGQIDPGQIDPGQIDPGQIDPSQVPGYVWPTEMSDNWNDNIVNIEGTLYKFPIPYTEFVSKGWKSKSLPSDIPSGDLQEVDFYNDNLTITMLIYNPTSHEVTLDNTIILGFEVDSRYKDVSEKSVIELAGGVKLFETTKAEAKKVYGSPDDTYDGSDYGYEEISYASYGYDKGLDLMFSTDTGKLIYVGVATREIPQGVTGADEIDTDPPAMNALYVAPTSASKKRDDNIITLDGVNYQLPCPVSAFLAEGWELDDDTEDSISAAKFDSSITTNLEKDGNKVEVVIENKTTNTILPMNGIITEMTVEAEHCELPASFPGGIAIGDDGSKIDKTYSDADMFNCTEYSFFTSYFITLYPEEGYSKSIRVSAYTDVETKKVTKYTYEESGYELE